MMNTNKSWKDSEWNRGRQMKQKNSGKTDKLKMKQIKELVEHTKAT